MPPASTPTDVGHRPWGRPEIGEFAEYALPDIDRVAGDDIQGALERQADALLASLSGLDDAQISGVRYSPDKWTIKEVVGHLIDDERIFQYRMLALARREPLALPGFDERLYVESAGFEQRPLAALLTEYRTVRNATVAFLDGLSADQWMRRGTVNGYSATVRGLAFHVAGHELRHVEALKTKYLPLISAHRPSSRT